MKRLLFIIVLISMCPFIFMTTAYAAFFEQGNYIEKNQWGVLEDLIADCKAGMISTDECAIYGCYALAALEPSRFDNSEMSKLMPSKYKLDKKSLSSNPYFFIDFLYDNENNFGTKALEEFRKSDWSDYHYLEDFKNNINILKIIENIKFQYTPAMRSMKSYQYRDFVDIMRIVVDNGYIEKEVAYLITFQAILLKSWFNNRNKDFITKYQLDSIEDINNMLSFFANSLGSTLRNSKNMKIINLINYFDNARKRRKFSLFLKFNETVC